MPVTISGDAYKRIEALAAGLSDERLRDLTIQLRDSLVGVLRNTEWGAGNIGRGLTQYAEPVRTATGGWMVGVGSLEILHREPAPPHTIKDFLEWYRGTYRPAEEAERAERRAEVGRKAAEARLEKIWADKVRSYEQSYLDLEKQRAKLNRSLGAIRKRITEFQTKRQAKVTIKPSKMIPKWAAQIKNLREQRDSIMERLARIDFLQRKIADAIRRAER